MSVIYMPSMVISLAELRQRQELMIRNQMAMAPQILAQGEQRLQGVPTQFEPHFMERCAVVFFFISKKITHIIICKGNLLVFLFTGSWFLQQRWCLLRPDKCTWGLTLVHLWHHMPMSYQEEASLEQVSRYNVLHNYAHLWFYIFKSDYLRIFFSSSHSRLQLLVYGASGNSCSSSGAHS